MSRSVIDHTEQLKPGSSESVRFVIQLLNQDFRGETREFLSAFRTGAETGMSTVGAIGNSN